jgi:excinuclease UvrABC helicase subunit UvrB
MSGFVGVNLIDYEKLTVQQKNRLKRKLQSRKQELQTHLREVDKALKVVEKKRNEKKSREDRKAPEITNACVGVAAYSLRTAQFIVLESAPPSRHC